MGGTGLPRRENNSRPKIYLTYPNKSPPLGGEPAPPFGGG